MQHVLGPPPADRGEADAGDDEEQDDDDRERGDVDVAHFVTSPGLAGWPAGGSSLFCSWTTIHSTMATTGM